MDDLRTESPCQKVYLSVTNNWGAGSVDLETWIKRGYPKRFTGIREVYCEGSNQKLPFYSVPLQYRNQVVSHFMLGSGMLHNIPQKWHTLRVKKSLLTTDQTVGEIALKFVPDGIRLKRREVEIILPANLAMGTMSVGYLDFLVFADSGEWFSNDIEANFLGTIHMDVQTPYFSDIQDSFERNIPDIAFETLTPFQVDNSSFRAFKALLANSTIHNLSLGLCHANIAPDMSFSYYAMAQSHSLLETYSAHILNKE